MKKEYGDAVLPQIELSYADVLTRPLFYPENQFSKDLVKLMKCKSFTKKEVEHLRMMGFNVTISVRKIEIPADCK
jgi:hypothetical protein